jgi:anti-sigma B factor antagonist
LGDRLGRTAGCLSVDRLEEVLHLSAQQEEALGDGPLDIRTEREGPNCVISLRGEIDLANAQAFRSQLRQAMADDGAGKIVVDMRELEFIDSSGIAVLVEALNAEDGVDRLRFRPSRFPAVPRVLELTGLTDRLPSPESDGAG